MYIPFYRRSGAGKLCRTVIAAVMLFSVNMAESAAGGGNMVPGQEGAATGPEAERAYFEEKGTVYGGYLFAQLGRRIVKIPLDKDKINGNAQLAMDFPDGEYYDGGYLLVDGGSLYINFMAYMRHGGLYRLTSPDANPEFVLKNGDGNGGFDITGSSLHPDELKFLTFSEYDAGEDWGTLYCYFPLENIAKKISDFAGERGVTNFPGITKDDEVIIARMENRSEQYGDFRISSIDKITVDVGTKQIRTGKLIGDKEMPMVFAPYLSADAGKLYLLGTGFWEYDLKKDTLRQIVDFKKIIPNWPDNSFPYSYGSPGFHFLSKIGGNGEYCVSGDIKAIYVNVIDGRYEVADYAGEDYSL
jgi:hypothetical protein